VPPYISNPQSCPKFKNISRDISTEQCNICKQLFSFSFLFFLFFFFWNIIRHVLSGLYCCRLFQGTPSIDGVTPNPATYHFMIMQSDLSFFLMQWKTKSKVTNTVFSSFFLYSKMMFRLSLNKVQNCLLLVFCLFWFVLLRIQNIIKQIL